MAKKWYILLLIGVLLLQTCCFTAFAEGEAEPAILYVAANGSDANPGTIDAPFATLERARDEIRDMKTGYRVPEKGVVVYVRGGVYNRLTSFSLLSQDSGTEKGPIVYRAYPGEEVTFVGGVNLDTGSFSKVSDSAVLERIIEPSARGKVMQADLAAMGVTDYGAINLRGIYSYEIPGMEQYKVPTPPELFFNGESMTLARYPNEGYISIDKVVYPGAYPRMWEDDKVNDPEYVQPEDRDLSDGFVISYKDERISKWTTADEIRLHGFWFFDWADQSMPVKAIDPAAKTIETTIPSRYQVRAGQRYYAYNLLEELDSPGEYYIDRSSGMLYFYPPSNLGEKTSIQLSLLSDYLIDISGASYIQIKDIGFTAMRGGAIRTDAESGSNRIDGCKIENTGAYAVYLNGTNNGIVNSHIGQVDGGVRLTGGDRNTLTPAGNYAENNHIEEFARLTKTYTSAIDFEKGVGNRASYNRMHGADHQAVGYGGNDHKLMYNEIYDVLRHADDAGVVYSVGDWTCRGMEFKYNYIHDISSVSETGLTGAVFAFYFDNRISGSLVAGNVIKNVPGGVFQHGGRDLKMVNNILINVQQAARISTAPLGNDAIEAYSFLNAIPYMQEPWKSRYPELSGVDSEKLVEPDNNHVENNLIVNTDGSAGNLPAAHATIANTGNLQLKNDPGFFDMAKQNYLLKQDAAVFEQNPDFQSLPFTRMGMYSDRALQRVANAITMVAGSPQTLVNGKTMWVDKNDWSKKPQIIEDRTYVPFRFIGESLGAKVEWNGETREITIAQGDQTIVAAVDSADALLNGEPIVLNAPVRVIDGTSYVPLRNVAELLGKKVYWNDIGLITISDNEALFSEKSDTEIISYLHGLLDIY